MREVYVVAYEYQGGLKDIVGLYSNEDAAVDVLLHCNELNPELDASFEKYTVFDTSKEGEVNAESKLRR